MLNGISGVFGTKIYGRVKECSRTRRNISPDIHVVNMK